ncbi:MAG TPA: cytochrome c oxidase subunit II [Gemmataceae bacterium]
MTTLADVGLFPDQGSTVAPRVDHVYYFIVGITVAISTAVAVLVIYFAIKYRRRGDEIPRPIVGSLVLETIWTVIPLGIALVMFAWSARLYMYMTTPPEDAVEVYVVGRQWMWKLQHPDGQREINELHVPVGTPVKLTLTSEDVIHSFFIPDFRVKQDAVPGRYTFLWFQAARPGRYRLYCAEYCGTDHSRMIGWVVAEDPADHQQWLSSRADLSLAQRGRRRFLQYQCVTCHTGTSDARAPNLEGVYNRRVHLADGRTVVADENYVRESILNPRAKVVAGFEPIMPTFQGRMPEDDLLELLAFIKALPPGGTPTRNEESVAPQSDPKADKAKPFTEK